MTDPAKKTDAPADASFMASFFNEVSSEISRALDALGTTVESAKGATSTSSAGTADAYKPSKYADKYKPSKNTDKNVIDIAGSGILELFRPLTKAKPEQKNDSGNNDWAEFTHVDGKIPAFMAAIRDQVIEVTHDMIEVVVVGAVTTFFPHSLDDFDHDHIEDVTEHAKLDHAPKDSASFGEAVHESAAGLDAKIHVEGAPAIPTLAKVHEVAKEGAKAEASVKDHDHIK